jgi:MFS family permease
MGATSMPRTNILISLICRTKLLNEPPAPSDSSSRERRHGGFMSSSGHSNPMNGTIGNLTASSIIIGEYNPQCSTQDIESAAAMLNLWGNLIAGVLGAITTPFWGKLSDRFGRIKPLAATSTVMFVSEIFMVMIAKFPDALPLGKPRFLLVPDQRVHWLIHPIVALLFLSWRWRHHMPQT